MQSNDIRRTLLLLLKNDQILLAMKKRGFGANRYNGVGGKLEPGETVERALIRETQEEIEVTPLSYEKMWEDDQYWMPLVLAGDKVRGTFEFDANDRMLNHSIKTVDSF